LSFFFSIEIPSTERKKAYAVVVMLCPKMGKLVA